MFALLRVAHIYVLAVQVVRPGDPLICASRVEVDRPGSRLW